MHPAKDLQNAADPGPGGIPPHRHNSLLLLDLQKERCVDQALLYLRAPRCRGLQSSPGFLIRRVDFNCTEEAENAEQ
jgi:hypothetical protein